MKNNEEIKTTVITPHITEEILAFTNELQNKFDDFEFVTAPRNMLIKEECNIRKKRYDYKL